MGTYEVTVTDMKCNGCEETIQDEIRHNYGVKRVSANHIEDTVELIGDEVNLDGVVEEINELGFTASK